MDELFILIAEDDADDRYLLQCAFTENGFKDELYFVENGVELMDYLEQLTTKPGTVKTPRFMMLDLNMPRRDGREVLREIKQNAVLKKIPVIIFSTTSNENEMKRCYEAGANSYITKPNSFENLIKTIGALRSYWVQASEVPVK